MKTMKMNLNEDKIHRLTEPLVERQEAINDYVIKTIAKQSKYVLDNDLDMIGIMALVHQLHFKNELIKMEKTVATMQKKELKEIKATLQDIAEKAYADTKPLFNAMNMEFPSLNINADISDKTNDIINKTVKNIRRGFQTNAFMLRNPKNRKKLIPTPTSQAYNQVINQTAQANQKGTINYDKAIQDALNELINSGLREVEYEAESGKVHTQSLDAAVRRNVLDAVRDINQTIQDEVGKQTGADGKEITVHRNPAPDHAPIQGHQFTNEEYEKLQNEKDFEDINGNKFTAIRRPIGMWNCRHFTYSIIIGITKPNFTPEELDKINKENEEGYTLPNGRHLTKYECEQEQRRMERVIRQIRQKLAVAKTCGLNTVLELEAQLHAKLDEYMAFSKACGLKPKLNKTLLRY